MLSNKFKALSDPIRCKILYLLKDKNLSAGDIASQFNITAPTVSYHLNILKKVDLIRESRYKNFIYYELNLTVFDEIILWFNNFKGDDANDKI